MTPMRRSADGGTPHRRSEDGRPADPGCGPGSTAFAFAAAFAGGGVEAGGSTGVLGPAADRSFALRL